MCAETFAAECGCGSKAAERYEAYEDPISDRQEYKIKELGGKLGEDMTRSEASDYIKELQGRESGTWRAESSPLPADPRVSPMDDGLHLPADSPALDLPRENAEIGGVDFKADSSPLPPDPRVSPLSEGLHTPSDTPTMAAESQKLGIIYRIDRDDKTADILGVLPSYAEGKKAMTYMFKSALEEYSEDSGEDLMSFSDGKKEFEWDESRSKKKKSLDFYHPTGYEDIIIVLQEYNIETLTDFYDMINEGKFSAETFNAESFGAESKFDKLAKEIAEEYEEKGKSPKEAMEIGEATAANIGRAKFGKRKFAKMGQKAEDDIDFDKSKADRNKDGRISDWERAVGNKVAKGIRESKRAEVGPHVPTRIAATTTPRGVVKTYTSIPAGDGHVVGQFTPDMDYAPSGMYGAESLTSSIEKGFGAVLGIMSGLIVGGFAMGAVSSLSKDDENRE